MDIQTLLARTLARHGGGAGAEPPQAAAARTALAAGLAAGGAAERARRVAGRGPADQQKAATGPATRPRLQR